MSLKNMVQFVGTVAHPEFNYLPSGTLKFAFSLCVNEWRPKAGGGDYEDTWVNNLVAFGKLAENMNKLCPPKTLVLVSGRFQPSQWQDKEGNTRRSYSFIVGAFNVMRKSSDAETAVTDPDSDLDVPVADANENDFPF